MPSPPRQKRRWRLPYDFSRAALAVQFGRGDAIKLLWQRCRAKRNSYGGAFGSLVPTFEVRVDSPYAWLNTGTFLSANPEMRPGGVGLTFYEIAR